MKFLAADLDWWKFPGDFRVEVEDLSRRNPKEVYTKIRIFLLQSEFHDDEPP
jgi:hypothetical protein